MTEVLCALTAIIAVLVAPFVLPIPWDMEVRKRRVEPEDEEE